VRSKLLRRVIPTLALMAIAATAWAAHVSHPATPTFHKTAWSLPIDPWGPGQAYLCPAGACTTDVRLYARTKTGFCNCFGGVADDDEIDRIGDVDLHGDDFTGTAPGITTELAGLKGRARMFKTTAPLGTSRRVLSIVVASDCKAVVATLVSDRDIPTDVETSARTLLAGADFQKWVTAQ